MHGVLRILVVVLGPLLIGWSGMSGAAPTLAAGTGQIYITEGSQIVRVNDMAGAGFTILGTHGTGVTQFNNPTGIFVDGAGRIYVTDWVIAALCGRRHVWGRLENPGQPGRRGQPVNFSENLSRDLCGRAGSMWRTPGLVGLCG